MQASVLVNPAKAEVKAAVSLQQQPQSSAEELRAMAVCQELLAEERKENAVKQARAMKKKAKKQQKKAHKQLSDSAGLHAEQNKQQHSTDLQTKDQFVAPLDSSKGQDDSLGDCALIKQDTSSTAAAAEAVKSRSSHQGWMCL